MKELDFCLKAIILTVRKKNTYEVFTFPQNAHTGLNGRQKRLLGLAEL